MFKYYKGKMVKVERYFVLGGVHYSIINLDGSDTTVKTTELADDRQGVIAESVLVPEDMHTTIAQDYEENPSTLKIDENGFEFVLGLDLAQDEDITSKVNTLDEAVIIDGAKLDLVGNIVSPTIKLTQYKVVAINNSGKKTGLGLLDELDKSPQVKKMKLDVEAINRCLAGEQKKHKGYSFKKVEA